MSSLMVVDDEEGVRRSLKKVLEKDGYRILLAENGEEALSMVRGDGREIETVISDYRMPGLDGLETLIEIGRLNTEITRIMLTGYATMASAIEAVNVGIDGFLTKPFENDELRAKVRECNIKKRLKQFVPEQVLSEIQRNREALLPKRLMVTVLFTDIRGFTALVEKLNPIELTELLNCHYFTPFDHVIFQHNGTLDKHIGDGIMSLFGAPLSSGNDAERAVSAALDARERLVEINAAIADENKRIAIGFGIATGEVMAGIFGSPWKKEYTVMGEAVILAARLEKLAAANQILICGETARLVADQVRMEAIPNPVIRGIERPPDVFSVIGKE